MECGPGGGGTAGCHGGGIPGCGVGGALIGGGGEFGGSEIGGGENRGPGAKASGGVNAGDGSAWCGVGGGGIGGSEIGGGENVGPGARTSGGVNVGGGGTGGGSGEIGGREIGGGENLGPGARASGGVNVGGGGTGGGGGSGSDPEYGGSTGKGGAPAGGGGRSSVTTQMLGHAAPSPGVSYGFSIVVAVDEASTGLEALLEELDDDGRIVHVERFAAHAARFGELARPLPDAVVAATGVERLFTHQVEAIDQLRQGQSVVVATGTASGKSLCYQIPIAEAAVTSKGQSTALLLFPTKALAQDQLRSLAGLNLSSVRAATFDGDTPFEQRTWIRNRTNTILTNPEMLHGSILPNHSQWARFLRRLEFVVIDELHVLRGVFGTHVSHVLRRLLRVARHYGAEPTFCFTSATIGEPAALASALCGLPVVEVNDDGSPHGPRTFALLNPPLLDPATGARSSTMSETASAVAALVRAGHRTIAFAQSRKGTELIAGDVRRRVNVLDNNVVRAYRGGYLPSERREIEAELASGTISAVIATNALELGIDIGDLDACVLSGFPGTIASMWQQAGRAGRSGQASLTTLVAGDDQLDQWLMSHPDQVFSRSPEPAVINVANAFIAEPHLACAAYELPLSHADEKYWPEVLDDMVRRLVLTDQCVARVHNGRPVAMWSGRGRPSHGVGLRSGSIGEVKIVDRHDTLIGTVDEARAPSLVHTGAIYLHRGETYRVERFEPDQQRAVVTRCNDDEYTQPRSSTNIAVLGIDDKQAVGPLELMLGQVEVTSHVTGYQRRDRRTRSVLSHEELALEPQRLVTRAFWYTLEQRLCEDVGVLAASLPGALHAAEHAMIGMLPLFTICDRWDVGGVSTALHLDTGHPSIFIYDGYPGGTGIAELGYSVADRHLGATLELLRGCGCDVGLPVLRRFAQVRQRQRATRQGRGHRAVGTGFMRAFVKRWSHAAVALSMLPVTCTSVQRPCSALSKLDSKRLVAPPPEWRGQTSVR